MSNGNGVSRNTFWPIVSAIVILGMSISGYAISQIDDLQDDVTDIKVMLATIDERTK